MQNVFVSFSVAQKVLWFSLFLIKFIGFTTFICCNRLKRNLCFGNSKIIIYKTHNVMHTIFNERKTQS